MGFPFLLRSITFECRDELDGTDGERPWVGMCSTLLEALLVLANLQTCLCFQFHDSSNYQEEFLELAASVARICFGETIVVITHDEC